MVPTAIIPLSDLLAASKVLVVPEERKVQWVPSVDVTMVPLLPTTRNIGNPIDSWNEIVRKSAVVPTSIGTHCKPSMEVSSVPWLPVATKRPTP